MADAVPVRVYIAVGANIEPERNITAGLMLLAKQVDIRAVSTFYRTPAIGHADQDDYLNGVIAIETVLSAHELKLDFLRDVERATGRRRSADAYAARPLDLDILLYGEHVIDDGEIEIPDPDITLRPFLAAGLLELNPSLTLPGDGRRLAERIDPGVIAALKKEDAFTRELKESLTHES
jgi:2-amino-4-hydroxy-6-hydroxymethyldihydropteridine diphosphokinase